MPKIELDGLPVIDADESEMITVAVSPDDLQAGDTKKPERHPVANRLAASTRRGRCSRVEARSSDQAGYAVVPI